MRTDLLLRPAVDADAGAINAIYNPYVLTSTATFQLEPSTLEERLAWLSGRKPEHAVLMAEERGEVVGWGSLNPYKSRGAYRLTAENSVYVRDDLRGRGIGGVLLGALIAHARVSGIHSILAGITREQEASIALHARFGF